MERNDLIQDLVADLKPVAHAGRIGRPALAWLAMASVYCSIATLITGPLRPDAFRHLLEFPWFALETLVAVATVTSLAVATLRLAIPSERHALARLALPLSLSAVWIAFYVVGLWAPAHPVSMIGQRAHCVLQAFFFSLPSFGLLLLFARRFMPLWPRTTGAVAGAAAAAIPAAWMQFACMYVPSHILMEHIGPMFLFAALGALIGPAVLTRRPAVLRSRRASLH
jgi:hypothetical protein